MLNVFPGSFVGLFLNSASKLSVKEQLQGFLCFGLFSFLFFFFPVQRERLEFNIKEDKSQI